MWNWLSSASSSRMHSAFLPSSLYVTRSMGFLGLLGLPSRIAGSLSSSKRLGGGAGRSEEVCVLCSAFRLSLLSGLPWTCYILTEFHHPFMAQPLSLLPFWSRFPSHPSSLREATSSAILSPGSWPILSSVASPLSPPLGI